MLRVVMYGGDPKERGRVRKLLEDILWSAGLIPVVQEFHGEREPFLAYVRNNPYLVMLMLEPGPAGAETARLAKEANPDARVVWFSDHDYALYAYGLHLTFFGLLPVSRRKMEQAMDACRFARGGPSWNDAFSLPHFVPLPQ